MSIPLDRLYHYIESVAQEVRGDNVIIYRFYPHGSKKPEDLTALNSRGDSHYITAMISPPIYCNDQEPLNFEAYNRVIFCPYPNAQYGNIAKLEFPHSTNFKSFLPYNIFDSAILIHSEQRSLDVEKYKQNQHIPVYYWSHAIIARDWFRYAQYIPFKKSNQTSLFLIYNRSWSGTREYRLKLVDLIINNDLVDHCYTKFNAQDPISNEHYSEHNYENVAWKPTINNLEDYFKINTTDSTASADFAELDYYNTEIEVVLETLFEDCRLHLTEKILRPIACRQPFLLCATHGSLEYLRQYGFKTFDSIWNEDYDLIQDPESRLQAIINQMRIIANWSSDVKKEKLKQAQEIAQYNQKHFFSDSFFNQVTQELKINLYQALNELESSNTSEAWWAGRLQHSTHPVLRNYITSDNSFRTRQDIVRVLAEANRYRAKSINRP